VKALLIANESPVRSRLAETISELPDVHLEVKDPNNDADQILLQFHPDVIMIDIDQTQGHGLELIRRFREGRKERSPVIMALASSGSLYYRESCLAAGAMYFFNLAREQDWLLESLASLREQPG